MEEPSTSQNVQFQSVDQIASTSTPEEEIDIEQNANSSSTRKSVGSCSALQKYLTFIKMEDLISRKNSISYLILVKNSYHTIEMEYMKFVDFIQKHKEPGKTQLTVILFPMFVHFYLLLLQKASDNAAAHAFYKQHSRIFEKAEGYQDILKDLYALKSAKEIKIHPEFKKYWKMKYTFRASLNVHQSLNSFLEDIDSDVLLSILRFHFVFKLVEEPTNFDNKELDFDGSVTHPSYRNPRLDVSMRGLLNQMKIYDPLILGLVIRCNPPAFLSMDVNEDQTQICLAHGLQHISTADVIKKSLFNRPLQSVCATLINGPMTRILVPESCYAVKYLPDNSNNILIATDTVRLLNTDTGRVWKSYRPMHSNCVVNFDVNLPLKLFATGSTDNLACVWSLYESSPLQTYVGHTAGVNVVKLHPNGIYLASGSVDTTVRLWSIDRSYCIRSYTGHQSEISCLAYSPNGQMFATGDLLGVIRIWNIKDNCVISEIYGYKTRNLVGMSKVTSLCFSPDSFMLASANFDGILKIWDLRTRTFCRSTDFDTLTPILIKSKEIGTWYVVLK